MALKGVLFDLGGTILRYSPRGKEWEDMEKIGALGIYNNLRAQNYHLPPESQALDIAWNYIRTLWKVLDTYDVKDLKLENQLSLLVAEWGVANVPSEVVSTMALAYMDAIQAHVTIMDGVDHALQTLHDQGIRIGLISNTIWPGLSHQSDLERFGLTHYFEHLIFSADVELWKPHREIFEMGLAALDLKPEEAAFVGDSLYFDVWGAQQAGLHGVWIEQPHVWLPDGIEVAPDTTIRGQFELLEALELWR
jgi:putative hydrolase of the HAD superfamily